VTDVTDGFEMVIGLEVHVQLKTASKAFDGAAADYGAPPNRNTEPLCLALPGTLPVLNARAVDLAVRAALGLGCTVHHTSVFARKHYFYPDLPKGYQISQHDAPLATAGTLDIGAGKLIGITRVHMEEDAGKSIHDRYPRATAVDLNRCGVPLIEIVSEPDLRSPEEAGAYLRTLKQILLYLDVSDCNMEEGSLRVDANVSARPVGQRELGTKCEVKNLNSFSGVERALATEYRRQCEVLRRGGTIQQQTLLWDGAKGEVRPARAKEGSSDYRYFPEPDLPPLRISPDRLAGYRAAMPELPAARRARYAALGLSEYDVQELTADPDTGPWFEQLLAVHNDPKVAANWVNGEVRATLKTTGATFADAPIAPTRLGVLLNLVRDGKLSSSAAKKVYASLLEGTDDAATIAQRDGLLLVRDDGALAAWIDAVFAAHPAEAQRFLGGEQKLQGVLVGLIMKQSAGRADPRQINQALAARLNR
jgi:aspartyl-tRNA(Asn)/glutamyl-tRNA(Gln) amidotransferase subunit B